MAVEPERRLGSIVNSQVLGRRRVNLVVELSRFAGFGSLLFDQSTFDSARVGVSNLVALTLSREGSGAWVGAIASKPTTPATVDPSARRGLVWSRTPTTQVIP